MEKKPNETAQSSFGEKANIHISMVKRNCKEKTTCPGKTQEDCSLRLCIELTSVIFGPRTVVNVSLLVRFILLKQMEWFYEGKNVWDFFGSVPHTSLLRTKSS